MDVWWYNDGRAGSLTIGWYHDVYSVDSSAGLPNSGNPAVWSIPVSDLFALHFPGVTTVYWSRTLIDVNDVPTPDAASQLLTYTAP